MSNPFFSAMNLGRMAGPMGNAQQMMQQFQQFRQSMQGKDPKAEVERMVREGRISQEQLDRAQQMAQQMAQFFK